MAELPAKEAISAEPTPAFRISTTMPDELVRHDISDDELGILGSMAREYLWEGMWAAVGILIGSVTNAVASIHAAYFANPATPLTIPGLIHVVIFFVALVLSAVLFFIVKRRIGVVDRLVKTIRDRTTKRIQHVER